MPRRRILLLGKGDLTEETAEALRAADAEIERLEDPGSEELSEALEAGADAVAGRVARRRLAASRGAARASPGR